METKEQSLEALEAEKAIAEEEEGEDDDVLEEVVDGDDADGGEVDGEETGRRTELGSSLAPIEKELGRRDSETLAVASSLLQLPENDILPNFGASPRVLSDVPGDCGVIGSLETAEFKDQVLVSDQEALESLPVKPSQAQTKKLLQSSAAKNTSDGCSPELQLKDSCGPKPLSSIPAVKIPSTDGYNWRKYGQKQVKSPQGSRSYYRCSSFECHAKKIECSDHTNHVIEIICKGGHNHDPPRKTVNSKESRFALCAIPSNTDLPVRMVNDSDLSSSSKEPMQEALTLPETRVQNLSGPDETAERDTKEHIDEPETKRRIKKSDSAHFGSPVKPGKKPKFVVHAAGDVGISGDGYRWRKYGQKMVKGNPHPRNYYRCTSAGCPVRKHIERAVDNTSAVIITYKGIHDHDMPVPKKRHGPPSASLVAAAAPSMNNLQVKKTESVQNQLSTTQWSVDRKGELTAETLDAGEEKAMESARTLLSIGFEIKQC